MKRRWVPLLVLPLAATFFWRLWLAPDGFLYPPNSPYSDLTITHWPNALFVRRSLGAWGQIPLWRPSILGGEPFAANPLSGLWYPPNLLLLILPLTPAFNLLFVLHTAWAGWGGYALARALGASRAGGLVTACSLMFAPKAVAHLAAGHVGLVCATAWLPWALWAARRLAERGRAREVAAAAVAVAMLVLADVRMGVYGGLAVVGYWTWSLWSGHGGKQKRRPYDAGVAAGLLAAALMAVQMLPLAAMAGRLSRSGLGLEESGRLSLPPRYLAGLLVADHGGYHEWMTYLGAVGLLLALVGLARWRSRERWWWVGLALTAAVYSLGTHAPLYGLLHRALPPLAWLRGPARAWFLVALAVAVLAGRGLTALEGPRFVPKTRVSRQQWMDRVAAGLIGAALAGAGGGLALRLPADVVVAAVIWPLGGALLALRASGRLPAPWLRGLALALMLADLWGVGFTLYRVRPADEVLAEGEAAAAWLAAQPSPFRVYSPSYSIPQHTGADHGIETADGVDPFQLADTVAFMRAATGVDLPGYTVTIPPFPEATQGENMLLAHRGVAPNLRLLGLLNVRYLAAAYSMEAEGLAPLGRQGGVYLYRNERALPRAMVVGQVEMAKGLERGLEGALAWLAGAENDPRRAAVVEGTEGAGAQGARSREQEAGSEGQRTEGREAGEARIVQWTPNRIQVEAAGPGLLVLSEIYDPDWRAQVDGRDAEIVRADGILRGVTLEEGQHQATFAYRPAGLWVGAGLTAVGWMYAAALWAVGRRASEAQ